MDNFFFFLRNGQLLTMNVQLQEFGGKQFYYTQ